MCTAISYLTQNHYFGRNLDLEKHFQESVTITPRNFPFRFRSMPAQVRHYAIIGMASVVENYPLYYDATNEKGLSIAGLNFPGFATYFPAKQGMDNVASFELIPYLLGQCATVEEVRKLLERLNLTEEAFAPGLPPSPLHWLIADRERSIVLEPMTDGLKNYENPVGVLTNNPPFDYHLLHLADFMHLHPGPVENKFAPDIPITPYSRGMSTIGLPGDLGSASRFVKAAYTKLHSVCDGTEIGSVSQFFHLLGSVEQQRGAVIHNGEYEITYYSSCCNTDKGIYYYTTYDNRQITAVDLYREDLERNDLISYPLLLSQQIHLQN